MPPNGRCGSHFLVSKVHAVASFSRLGRASCSFWVIFLRQCDSRTLCDPSQHVWHPVKSGWGGRDRTSEWRNQNPLPYRLATPQQARKPCRQGSRNGAEHTGIGRGAQPAAPAGESRPEGAESWGFALAGQCFGGYNAAFEPARSVAQSGSAPRSGRGGRRFESCHSDQVRKRKKAPGASRRGSLPRFRVRQGFGQVLPILASIAPIAARRSPHRTETRKRHGPHTL